MATAPGYIQVAADGVGKKMRTEVDSVRQPDGTLADVHREIVSGPPEWFETAQDEYMRQLQENILIELRTHTQLLATMMGPTSATGSNVL